MLEIINDLASFRLDKSVATIGIFDGVHRAHQEIIRRIKQKSDDLGCPSVLITLWPHPRKVLYPGQEIALLTTLEEKYERIETTGIDYMVVLPFTKDLANTTYQDFIRKYVYETIYARYILIGYNHHFGKNRQGSYETLKVLSKQFGFTAERLEPFHVDEWKVSSSLIRKCLWEGNVVNASKLLGYPYFLEGRVVKGNQLGKKMGFPTANTQLGSADKLIPVMGVYACYIETMEDRSFYKGMLNIGRRPTISSHQQNITIEANIFDFNRDIYGQNIRIHFIERIRDEKKFESLDALVNQLKKDKTSAYQLLDDDHLSDFSGGT